MLRNTRKVSAGAYSSRCSIQWIYVFTATRSVPLECHSCMITAHFRRLHAMVGLYYHTMSFGGRDPNPTAGNQLCEMVPVDRITAQVSAIRWTSRLVACGTMMMSKHYSSSIHVYCSGGRFYLSRETTGEHPSHCTHVKLLSFELPARHRLRRCRALCILHIRAPPAAFLCSTLLTSARCR